MRLFCLACLPTALSGSTWFGFGLRARAFVLTRLRSPLRLYARLRVIDSQRFGVRVWRGGSAQRRAHGIYRGRILLWLRFTRARARVIHSFCDSSVCAGLIQFLRCDLPSILLPAAHARARGSVCSLRLPCWFLRAFPARCCAALLHDFILPSPFHRARARFTTTSPPHYLYLPPTPTSSPPHAYPLFLRVMHLRILVVCFGS